MHTELTDVTENCTWLCFLTDSELLLMYVLILALASVSAVMTACFDPLSLLSCIIPILFHTVSVILCTISTLHDIASTHHQ